jgi:hypothetical protein
VYRATFMVGQGLDVVALFDSDDEGRAQEAVLRTEWLPHYKDAHSSTVLLGAALEQTGDVGIADLLSERHYLRKAHERSTSYPKLLHGSASAILHTRPHQVDVHNRENTRENGPRLPKLSTRESKSL